MKRQRLGQHYLVDPRVVEKMVDSAEIAPEDRILEIGTGRGALTKRLASLGASFEGFEVDPENYRRTLVEVEGLGAKVVLLDAF